MEKYGKIIAPDVLRFERLLPGPIEKVWAYLTESEKRGKWLAKGDMELFEGGKVTLQFLHKELCPDGEPIPENYKHMDGGHTFTGTVLKVQPPHLLSFTWEDLSEVTFELTPTGNMVMLVLTHRKISDNKKTRIAMSGGWHTHLAILAATLEGTTPPSFWKKFGEMEETYSAFINVP